MTSLKQKTISGIKWTTASAVALRILSFGTTVILARLLSPADFGLFALAMVVIDGFGIFKSLGFDSALVRKQDNLQRAYNTAFVLIPIIGIFIFILLFFTAPLAAKFLNNVGLVGIIRALGIVFVISCFSKVSEMIIYKAMNFKYKSLIELTGAFVFSVIALILAFQGAGVWSLVYAYIVRVLVQGLLQWFLAGWRPKFEFDMKIALEMFHFGKYLLGSSVLGFIYRCIDKLLIGKLLGVTMLGYYSFSLSIVNLLNDNFLSKFSTIMFPALSKIQNDNEKIKQILAKAIKYASLVAFPFSVLVFFYSREILLVVFGEKWLPAENILKLLSFIGIMGGLSSQVWPALLAKGKSKVDFLATLVQTIFFVLLVVPLANRFGLMGTGAALCISSFAGFWIGFLRARTYLSVRLVDYYNALRITLGASLGMFLAAAICWGLAVSFRFNYFYTAPVVIGAYLVLVYSLDRNIVAEVKALFV